VDQTNVPGYYTDLARRHPFSPQNLPQNFWDQILLISYYNQDVGGHILEQPCGQSWIVAKTVLLK
jgi:hypothetical protein